jgi:predicted phosphodiesterase
MTTRLINEVRQRQAMGASENAAVIEVAAEMDITYDAAYNRFRRVAGTWSPVPRSRYPAYDNPRLPAGDYLCLGDLHAPYHDAPFINRAILAAHEAGVKSAIIGGDWLDNQALSAWPENFKPAPNVVSGQTFDKLMTLANTLTGQARQELIDAISDTSEDDSLQSEIKSVREVLTALNDSFETVYYIMGNHEQRLIRKLEKAIGSADFAALFMGNSPKAHIVPFYWVEFESGGQPWRVTHPTPAGKGVSGLKLAAKYQANVIMFHNHHFSVRSEISGRFVGIEPGMCLDEARAHYVMVRDNGADTHITGGVVVQDGRFRLLNKWSI